MIPQIIKARSSFPGMALIAGKLAVFTTETLQLFFTK